MAVENPGQGTATLNGTRQASTIRRPYEVTRHGPLHGIGAVEARSVLSRIGVCDSRRDTAPRTTS